MYTMLLGAWDEGAVLMALTWDIREVVDHKELCYYQKDDGKNYLHPVTDALIWTTMMIDMGEIPEELR